MFLSPTDAGSIAKVARKLLRRGQITHRELTVIDCLLWSCRAPGKPSCRVSYTRLQALCRVSRETVAAAVKRLADLRLIRVIKHTVMAVWANGGRQCRQAVNEYELVPPTDHEFAGPTVLKGQEILLPVQPSLEVKRAQAALAIVRARRERALTLNRPGGGAVRRGWRVPV